MVWPCTTEASKCCSYKCDKIIVDGGGEDQRQAKKYLTGYN